MKKVLVYSASGIPFKNGKVAGIISEDLDGGLRSLMKSNEIEVHMPARKQEDLPSHYKWFNIKTPSLDWDLSQFDEIIVTGSNLGLFGGVLSDDIVGFIHGLKTFKGTGSVFLTDTTIPKFTVISKLHDRIHKPKPHGLKSELDIATILSEENFKAALAFEESIDKCYCAFFNTDNKFTQEYGTVEFIDSFRTALKDRDYSDRGLFGVDHDQLIQKACYIGNYKPIRVRRLKKLGIYNPDLVDYFGKVSKEFQPVQKIKIDQVVSCYKNYFAAVVVVDNEMNSLGLPHRWIQSALSNVPTILDVSLKDSIKYELPQELKDFMFFGSYRELKSTLEKLKDPKYFQKILDLQTKVINKFLKEPVENII